MATNNEAISPCTPLFCTALATLLEAGRLFVPMLEGGPVSFWSKVRLGAAALTSSGLMMLASACNYQETYGDSEQEVASFTFGAGR